MKNKESIDRNDRWITREKDGRKARWTKGEQGKKGSWGREERQGVKGGR